MAFVFGEWDGINITVIETKNERSQDALIRRDVAEIDDVGKGPESHPPDKRNGGGVPKLLHALPRAFALQWEEISVSGHRIGWENGS